ncbi:MAG: SCO family protein [Pseudomonadota bacterium]
MNRIPLIASALFALLLLAGGAMLLLRPTGEPTPPLPTALQPVVPPEIRQLEPFALTDIEQETFDLSRLQGKWTLMFFGYTHCPDICPTTLTTLRGVARELEQTPGDSTDTQFVFVSVDPKRDRLDHLKAYVRHFHPDFIAATGDKAEIDRLVRQLGAVYIFDGDTSGENYIVNHSAGIAVIDPQGRWVGRFNPPHEVKRIVDNLRRLRDHFEPNRTPAG